MDAARIWDGAVRRSDAERSGMIGDETGTAVSGPRKQRARRGWSDYLRRTIICSPHRGRRVIVGMTSGGC
jgi:hypothetical protein